MPYLKIHRENKNEMDSVLHCKCSTAGWHFWHDICVDAAQTSQNQHKAQGCIHCRQTMNHHFAPWLQGPWKLLYFILQFPFFSPPFLKIVNGHWFLWAVLQKTTEKLHPVQICFVLLLFLSISKYDSCLSTKIWCWRSAAREPAWSSLGTDLLDPHHRLRKPLTPVCLCSFGCLWCRYLSTGFKERASMPFPRLLMYRQITSCGHFW